MTSCSVLRRSFKRSPSEVSLSHLLDRVPLVINSVGLALQSPHIFLLLLGDPSRPAFALAAFSNLTLPCCLATYTERHVYLLEEVFGVYGQPRISAGQDSVC